MDLGMRDWLLILGGLLIIGVLGHGLWIAWRARRADVRVRYETNIPDLDMDDIDLLRAELPSGGARVVSRDDAGAAAGGEGRRPAEPAGRPKRSKVALDEQVPVLLDPIDQDLEGDAPEPAAGDRAAGAAEGPAQQESAETSVRADAGRQEEPARPAAEPEETPETRQEPEQAPLFAGEPIMARDRPAGRSGTRRSAVAKGMSKQEEKAAAKRAASRPSGDDGAADSPPEADFEDVLVINVLRRAGKFMAGSDLMEVVAEHGLRYGDMNIFHRYADGQRIEFSMASAVKPGTFDLGAIDQLETPGVVFFLRLPGPDQPLEAFEDMAAVAGDMATRLDAELKDERHSVMTGQTLEHCRQRIREFRRRQMSRRG